MHGTRPAADGLREDPASDDESTVAVNGNAGDNAAVRLNGGMSGESGESDDHDMQDADVEEDLDDMDRISSSPSISDGGLPFPSSATCWLGSSSTLSRDSSSPFTQTPVHFPLSVAAARRSHRVPVGTLSCSLHHSCRPLTHPSLLSQFTQNLPSADHHRGEYTRPETTGDEGHAYAGDGKGCTHSSLIGLHLTRVEDRLQRIRLDSESLTSESDDGSCPRMLGPPLDTSLNKISEGDPFCGPERSSYMIPKRTSSLLGSYAQGRCRRDEAALPSQTSADDENFWTDDSDADTWDATSENDDDDSNDVSLPFLEYTRFVDSGWGGECLRELEDIDFEFVYSLHTFVATVEGQANATKGDTMVLLDDSNSYWVCSTNSIVLEAC